MDLTNKTTIKELLKKYGAKPEKYFGQHFILSKKALTQMVAAAEIKKNDVIVEIGPGFGTLTQELVKIPHPLKKGGGLKIIAIEKDHIMISILKETLADYKNIKIVQADARKLSISKLISEIKNFSDFGNLRSQYKIVANLPYNVATFLIRQWLESKNPPELMVLMIQKEVAQRICPPSLKLRRASAKSLKLNLLSISIQFYADAKIIGYVSKEMFWPAPKVDAAIIKIVPKNKRGMTVLQAIANRQSFFKVVKAGFSQPRKQLIGNLTKKFNIPREKLLEIFKNLNISERARAENLSLDQWASLAISLHFTIQRK